MHRGTQREFAATEFWKFENLERETTMSSNGNNTNRNGKMNWESDPRWKGITRPYTWADVESLRGSMRIEHSLARHGAETFGICCRLNLTLLPSAR